MEKFDKLFDKSDKEIGNFKCQKIGCDKSFKTKLDLKRHLLAHLKIRTYECEFCGKRFISRRYLDDHYNLHTGERPYPCPHTNCRRRFRTAARLDGHIAKMHSPNQASYIFPNLRDQGSVIHIHNGQITRIPLIPCMFSFTKVGCNDQPNENGAFGNPSVVLPDPAFSLGSPSNMANTGCNSGNFIGQPIDTVNSLPGTGQLLQGTPRTGFFPGDIKLPDIQNTPSYGL